MPSSSKNPTPACKLADCVAEPATRGLCEIHYATHRGLADREEGDRGPADAYLPARP